MQMLLNLILSSSLCSFNCFWLNFLDFFDEVVDSGVQFYQAPIQVREEANELMWKYLTIMQTSLFQPLS